jgi:hypothetical protein
LSLRLFACCCWVFHRQLPGSLFPLLLTRSSVCLELGLGPTSATKAWKSLSHLAQTRNASSAAFSSMPDGCGSACLLATLAILAIDAIAAAESATTHEKPSQEARQILTGLELDLDRTLPVDQLGQLLADLQFGRKNRLLLATHDDTQSTMISWSKCRPLKSSGAEVGSVIAGR